MEKSKIVELDVRPILAKGVDPFEAIMAELKKMNDDQTLLVINTFEPVPLLNILKNKGYEYKVERPEEGAVYTYLTKVSAENENPQTAESASSKSKLTFEQIEAKYAQNMNEIDVRDLEMPLPMVTILEEIEKTPDSKALFVHHKKLPQYLLPELADRGYNYVHKVIDEDNLKLIIYR